MTLVCCPRACACPFCSHCSCSAVVYVPRARVCAVSQFLIMNNKFPSLCFPWYQIQTDLQRILFGEKFWKAARERIARMPSKPGNTSVPVVYDEFAGK